MAEPQQEQVATKIPAGVWAISSVSFFMQISNSLVYSIFPVYQREVLGFSMFTLGLIEGIAHASMAFSRFISGAFSDWLGKRKPLALTGYGLTMFTRAAIPLVRTPLEVVGIRFVERLGIGIRSAPRDALIADHIPRNIAGASYGLRHSLDRCGALIGPLLTMLFMFLLSNNYRIVFWIAVIPAVVSVIVLYIFVKDVPVSPAKRAQVKVRWKLSDLRSFGAPLWWFIVVNLVMHLSYFSEAFLVLRASDAGLSSAYIPLVLAIQNLVIASTAYPIGKFSDRIGRTKIVALGFFLMIIAHLLLSVATTVWLALFGAALWGLVRSARSVTNAIVSDLVPSNLRGSAFGVIQMSHGFAGLTTNIMAGYLWHTYSPELTYQVAAGVTAISLVLFLMWMRRYGHVLKKKH
ncbi:MAG: MFS transporter [Rhodospirillaceae bacterium]